MANLNGLLKLARQDNSKTLSKEDEVRLGEIIRSSDSTESARRAAIRRLVYKNIFLVLKLSHGYKRKEFEFEDLVGYGILGLFTAARKFDPTRENRFASYARHWIKESIMKAIREYSGMPKIPVYSVKNLWRVTRILAKDDNISDEALATKAEISEKDAIYLRSLMFKFIQFDASYVEGNTITPEAIYQLKERDRLIHQVLSKCLTSDEFTVLAHTHELCGYPKMTFAKMEEELDIKHPRRLKADALKKLRKDSIMQGLHKEGW